MEGEISDPNLLLERIIQKKIYIEALKHKKKLLLEELYRKYLEGENEPKKYKKRKKIVETEAVVNNPTTN